MLMYDHAISDKKQKLIDEVNNSVIKEGDEIAVKYNSLGSYKDPDKVNKTENCKVVKILTDNKLLVKRIEGYKNNDNYTISLDDVVARQLYYIGSNPFNSQYSDIRSIQFSLESIIHNCDILGDKRKESDKVIMNGVTVQEVNWNPYVYIDGKKKYYQRDFCWSEKDNQLLIESIYQGVDCGKILIRLRGWDNLEIMSKNGEKELAFRDIVDGKQRLNAIRAFVMGEFPDLHGNYYGDLSNQAQNKLGNHQLFSYSELPESTKDEEVLYQFLRLNFAGVPQSQEHIDYVKSLMK